MNKTNVNKIINDIVFITNVEQELDNLVANSHFLQFKIYDNRIEIHDKYILPGKVMKNYLDTNLPVMLYYDINNFNELLIETIDRLQNNLIGIEYQENNL